MIRCLKFNLSARAAPRPAPPTPAGGDRLRGKRRQAARDCENYKPHNAARAPEALIGCAVLSSSVTSGRGGSG